MVFDFGIINIRRDLKFYPIWLIDSESEQAQLS